MARALMLLQYFVKGNKMKKVQVVNLNVGDSFEYNGREHTIERIQDNGYVITGLGAFGNPSVLVNYIEPLVYPSPQVITIFIPNFQTKKIKIRQLILSNDWVSDCYDTDAKYGIWFTTLEQAQAILKLPTTTEI